MSGDVAPFLSAWLLDRHGRGKRIDVDAVSRWQPGDGLLWLHLDIMNPAAQHWLVTDSHLEDIVSDTLAMTETRPRAVSLPEGLLLVLRGVNMNPGEDPEDMVAVRLWIEHDRIISSRRRRVLAVVDMESAIEHGKGPLSSGNFLVMLTERLAERIADAVGDVEDAIERMEDESEGDAEKLTTTEISQLRRSAASLRRYLAPQRDALERMNRDHGAFLNQDEALDLREQADRMTRLVEDLDLARERATVLQEEHMSRLAQAQNARMYLLSVVAAIFLPLSFLTGLLGMNVAGLPGTQSPLGFTVSVVVMVAVGFGLVTFFKWKKWI